MDITELDESALIEQAKSDREAFGRLYERYVDRIHNYVYYRTGNSHDAEDLTARIFYRAIRHIGNYEDRGAPFAAWLYRIARNMVANYYRDNKSDRLLPLESACGRGAGAGPEATVELLEDREVLLAAIRQLPPERQELLILKFVERLPNAEIGQIMGRTEGAIKLLYYRTLQSLRQEMAGWR
ncbi:MAG: sigma-70 family RNA polymerase sigma factor [Chloroflexota bacterium]|jgi:RNA polymerase sigma-70 factor (ECF subfamily)